MSLNLQFGMRAFWAVCVLGPAPYLYAVDGVTLINQPNAQAGKITPGDTPGFPVTISQSGSYRLSSNLVVPDAVTTTIAITADNVTLDLNGSAFWARTYALLARLAVFFQAGGIGIQAVNDSAPSPANVRVLNGTVRGMGSHGVRMMGDGTTVERVHSMMNGGPGIVVGQGSGIDSVVRLNGGGGSALVGLIVRNNISTNSSNIGISVRNGGIATGNIASYNDGTGMRADFSTVTGNTVSNNRSFGIESLCPGALTGNTATQNANANIATNGACTMANNAQ